MATPDTGGTAPDLTDPMRRMRQTGKWAMIALVAAVVVFAIVQLLPVARYVATGLLGDRDEERAQLEEVVADLTADRWTRTGTRFVGPGCHYHDCAHLIIDFTTGDSCEQVRAHVLAELDEPPRPELVESCRLSAMQDGVVVSVTMPSPGHLTVHARHPNP